jgi:uncharacterized protein YprB with RNaseH-like and TPR domain
MIAPVERLKKSEIVWLSNHYCKAHRHSFLEHFSCWQKEQSTIVDSPYSERIGILDIEATGLKGNWDFMLSYAIKELDKPKIYGRVLTPKEILSFTFDRKLVGELIQDLAKFDRIVGHYIRDRRFDLPFIRARALKWKLDFPTYGMMKVTDTYDLSKNKLCLHSHRLEAISQHLGIPSKGHRQEPDKWQRAQAGSKKDLAYTWTHNIEDVASTEAVFKILRPYSMKRNTSI